jgi:hypothetical protein
MYSFLPPKSHHESWHASDYLWDDVRLVARGKQDAAERAGLSSPYSDDGAGSASADWAAPGAGGRFEDKTKSKHFGPKGRGAAAHVRAGEVDVITPGSAAVVSAAAAASAYVGGGAVSGASPNGGGSHAALGSLLNSFTSIKKGSTKMFGSLLQQREDSAFGTGALRTNDAGAGLKAGPPEILNNVRASIFPKVFLNNLSSAPSDGYGGGGGGGGDTTDGEGSRLAFSPDPAAPLVRISTYLGHIKTNLACRIEGCLEVCGNAYTARSRVCLKHLQAGTGAGARGGAVNTQTALHTPTSEMISLTRQTQALCQTQALHWYTFTHAPGVGI